MTIRAAYAKQRPHLMDIAVLGRFPRCLLESVVICGPVPITKPTPKPDGVVPMETLPHNQTRC
jgi:hypothetical protein